MTMAAQQQHDIFWGEVSPGEHLCHFYGDDAALLDSLEGFVSGGLDAGEAIVIIATPEHRATLEKRVWARGHALDELRRQDRYIDLDARQTLDKFMVLPPGGKPWPDYDRFCDVINGVLTRARWGGRWGGTQTPHGGRKVRAFGEMVALLWAQGHTAATVELERLWNRLCEQKTFSLFCAYPQACLIEHGHASAREICAAHTRMFGVPPLAA